MPINYNKSLILLTKLVNGQDGWILAEFSFCVFMDQDEVLTSCLVNDIFILLGSKAFKIFLSFSLLLQVKIIYARDYVHFVWKFFIS